MILWSLRFVAASQKRRIVFIAYVGVEIVFLLCTLQIGLFKQDELQSLFVFLTARIVSCHEI